MKFSIITVVKNSISNIALTIKSVKNQTFKNYEHIIIDGMSTDGTSQYIKKNINKKIFHFRENDKGLYDALNKSFKRAKGEYFIILHSGDFFYSDNSLKILSKFIKDNINYDFYYSNILFYSKEKNKISRIWKIPFKNKSKYNFLKIPHTSLCIHKKVSKKIYYDKKFRISADTTYLLKLCNHFNGKYINKFLIYMENNGLSTSRKFLFVKFKEDLQILYKEFKLNFIFVLIYKILLKIPGMIAPKKKYDKKFSFQINKLNQI